MGMNDIKLLLVDDSPLFIGALKNFLSNKPGITIVGTASNGLEALELVPKLMPTVILCDVQMPKMSGIEFLKALLPKYRIPVVVISGTPGVTLSALRSGAVDFISKPQPNEPKEDFFIRVLATVRTAAIANVGAKTALRRQETAKPIARTILHAPKDFVIAIGASTGGTDAIVSVVKELPANSPGVIITQHMPEGFTSMYAGRLNKECKMKVSEARDGMRLEPGTMILAAGSYHMRLLKDAQGYFVSSKQGPKVSGHIPSVDVMFNSVAEVAGRRALGVILTGMGADGADGLLNMRRTGAYTVGQDKDTCVVYGMPMVAFNKGAVQKQLPLDSITGEIVRYVNGFR